MNKPITLFVGLALIVVGICIFVLPTDKKSDTVPEEQRSVGRKKVVSSEKEKRKERAVRPSANRYSSVKRWIPLNVEPVLRAGGRDFNIRLAGNGNISDEVKSAIYHELNLIYSHLDKHDVMPLRRPQQMPVNDEFLQIKDFVHFKGKGRYFPKSHTGKIGFIVGEDLIVPESIVEDYREALEQKKKYAAEYAQLLEAINQLNELEKHKNVVPSSWFYIDPAAANSGLHLPDISSEDFIAEYTKYGYRQPSLLDIKERKEESSGVLTAKVYVRNQEGRVDNALPLLIYEGGRWKFFITLPPT